MARDAAERAVLREAGNMSAPTVMFVLQKVLATRPTGRLMLAALGPGFTLGDGSIVSPAATELGALPSIPLFTSPARVPRADLAPDWPTVLAATAGVTLVLVVIAVLIVLNAQDKRDQPVQQETSTSTTVIGVPPESPPPATGSP